MIRKHGFVSNSSTTSFMIYGIALESYEAAKILKRDHPAVKESIEKWGDDEPLETLDGLPGFDSYPSEWGDHKYFGVSWDNVKDDETGAEFKERVRAALAEYLEGDLSLGTHEESWYNG